MGLFKALSKSNNVIPIFIFDTNILSKLPVDDPRIQIIYDKLESINESLNLIIALLQFENLKFLYFFYHSLCLSPQNENSIFSYLKIINYELWQY